VIAAAWAVARRPDLWWIGLVTFVRFVPDGWWRRPPFVPWPDRALLRFRLVTQYGDAERRPEADDVVAWLEWCRKERRRR